MRQFVGQHERFFTPYMQGIIYYDMTYHAFFLFLINYNLFK